MSLFAYTARSRDGAFVAGSIQADSLDHVLAHLRSRSLFVTSLEPRATARGVLSAAFTALPVRASARLAFFRSLAALARAGVPLHRGFEVAIEQCHDARLAEALRSVASDIASGSSLAAALSRRPGEFPVLFVAIVRAGELGGVLDEVLERLAAMLERDRAVRKRLIAALAYPSIVGCAAAGLVLFLIATIVPAFAGLFAQMHVDLPRSTRIVIWVGNCLRSPLADAASLAAILAVGSAIRVAWSHAALGPALDRALLAVPVLGPLLRKAIIARVSRTLGTLLRSGVTLLDSLDACRDVASNALYAQSIAALGLQLREGCALAQSLERSTLFDPVFLQLVRVGEETGTLDSMLLRIAEYVELDVETAITALGSIVEPALIILLGAAVGTIVGSVLIPLYSVIGSIK